MHRKVTRKLPYLTKDELMDEINIASASMDLCPAGSKVFSFSKIKRYLKRQDHQAEKEVIFQLKAEEDLLPAL